MTTSARTIAFTFQRTIHAPPAEVCAAWLNPRVPGTPWHEADQLRLDPTRNAFFYLLHGEYPHCGRFTQVQRPRRILHTWVSPNTLGEEWLVTLTFRKKGAGTLLTLRHAGLPATAGGRAHEEGWNCYLGIFPGQFGS